MDPSKPATAPYADWNPGEKSVMDPQPPRYQDYNATYNPPPGGYPNWSGFPQGQPYGALYGQPYQGSYQCGPAVTVQPAVYVTSNPQSEPLPDYLGYSIFTMLCCCFPLGVAALIYSIKTQDANRAGHRAEAEKFSALAHNLNYIGLRIGVVVIGFSIFLTMYFTLSVRS
ncbi:proline-rich transmembrane protein 1-like [Salminus brasiliensis]|uniref:proline-rich transmembrane protein 1-like n=1 Tax=Salminus brasiliensis TaxID=930266 RepID=UPI003B82F1B3